MGRKQGEMSVRAMKTTEGTSQAPVWTALRKGWGQGRGHGQKTVQGKALRTPGTVNPDRLMNPVSASSDTVTLLAINEEVRTNASAINCGPAQRSVCR